MCRVPCEFLVDKLKSFEMQLTLPVRSSEIAACSHSVRPSARGIAIHWELCGQLCI